MIGFGGRSLADNIVAFDAFFKEREEQKLNNPTLDEPKNEFDDFFAGRQKDRALDQSLRIGSQSNPDEVAEAIGIADGLNLPVDTVERNLPETQEVQRQRNIKALVEGLPSTTEWLSDPENVKLAHDDVENLTAYEGLVNAYLRRPSETPAPAPTGDMAADYRKMAALNLAAIEGIPRAYKRGVLLHQQGYLGVALRRSGDDPEILEAIKESQAKSKALGEAGEGAFSFLEEASEVFGQMLEGMTSPEAAARTGAGAVVGAIVGLGGGPFAPVTSAAGALTGAGAGFVSHLAVDSYIVEGGLSYIEQLEEGIDPEVARYTSLGVGVINAALEVIGARFVLKPITAAGRRMFAVGLKEAMKRATVLGAAKTLGLTYGASVLGETTTEVMQEAVNIAAEEIGKHFSEGEFDSVTQEEVTERLAMIAEKVFKAMVVLSLPAPGANFAMDVNAARRATDSKMLFEALGSNAEASKLRARLPAKYREFVLAVQARAAEEGGAIDNVYVDPTVLQTLMQDGVIDDLIEDIPELAQTAIEARTTGQKVAIPLADYQTHIAGTGAGQALMGDIAFLPDDMTSNEADRFNTEVADIMKSEYEAALKAHESEQERQGPYDRIFDGVLAQLTAAGQTPEAARHQAALHVAQARVLEARYGVDPQTVYGNLQIRGPVPESIRNPVESIDLLIEAARRGVPEGSQDLLGESLQDFARRRGISDDRGDLVGIDDDLKPFQRKMLREDGDAIDKVREAAVEAGYFPQGADDISTFIEALTGDPLYIEDRGQPTAAARVAAAEDLIETLSRLGVDLDAPNAEIKAALDAAMADEDGGVTFEQSAVPAFYSKALRYVEESQQGKASGSQWRATMKKAGIKDEELAWLGLDGFLSSPKAITREELEAYVRANQVQVEEVTKPSRSLDDTERAQLTDELAKVREVQERNLPDDGSAPIDSPEYEAAVQREGEIVDTLNALPPLGDEQPTKFSTYTLPGGENYRELLLTLPGQRARLGRYDERLDEIRKLHGAQPGEGYESFATLAEKQELDRLAEGFDKTDDFTGGHFDEPNVLAHVRFNERVDANGDKVLFIEEVQSDWHAKGRSSGYAETPEDLPPANQFRIQGRGGATEAPMPYILGEQRTIEVWRSHDNFATSYLAQRHVGFPGTDARAIELARESEAGRAGAGTVPDAPFKKTWHELTFRRMVRWAAENGFDRIGWTTGKQQADRYDLSKQIDKISWVPSTGDFHASKGGSNVITQHGVAPGDLDDLIGKDAAARLRESSSIPGHDEGKTPFHQLEGEDLRVGGESLKSLYDKMLPNYARKFGKKFGAEVGDVRIGSALEDDLSRKLRDNDYDPATSDDLLQTILADNGGRQPRWLTDADMEAISSGDFAEAVPAPQSVHSMTITDKMRDTAMSEGFPLFQDKAEGSRGSIQFFPDRTVINLVESADLSTFLHESGHLFINTLMKIAETNELAAADVAAMMKFAGVESIEAFQQTEAQEKLARAFEAYLREGKAPSPALQSAFARYRAWLINIYRSLLKLDVEINDEIRGVFDRMLATDDEIAEAERINDFIPKDAIAEMMTDEERAAYVKAGAVASDQAAFQLEKLKIAEMTREETERWKEEYEKIRGEIAAGVDAQPVYQAIDAIRDRDTPLYMSREAVVEMLGEEATRALPGGLTRVEGGTHPDLIGDQVGFSSGDEMLFAMMNAAKNKKERAAVVREIAEDRMHKLHGSLNENAAQAAEAASDIVHNDERGLFLAMELRAMTRETGGQATLASVAKAAAARIIAGKKSQDAIQVGKYAAAEVRSAKEVTRALLKGDIDAAQEAKRQQLLNHYLFMEARKAAEELDKMVRYFGKFGKRSKTLDPGYADQIDGLLERFDFRRAVSLKEIERRKKLAAFVDEQLEDDQPISIPEALLDNAYKQHYKDTTLEELRGLKDTVKHLETLGRLKNRLLSDKKRRELDAAVLEMTDSIRANWRSKTRPRKISLTPIERAGEWVKSHMSFRRIEFMMRELDGFKPGPMHEVVWGIMSRADDNLQERRAAAAQELKALFSGYKWREVKKFFTKKVFIPEIGTSLTKESILAVALNTGNIDNREKLLKGYGWSEDQLKAVLSRLDQKRDWELVQGIWDQIDTYWAETEALDKETTGQSAPKIEAEGFENAHGKWRGGYYRIKWSARDSQERVAYNSAKEIFSRLMMGDIGRPTTNKGRTIERVNVRDGLLIRLDLRVFFEAIDEAMHDIAFRKAAMDLAKILKHPQMVETLKDTIGEPGINNLNNWMKDSITEDMGGDSSWGDKAIAHVRKRTTIMAMGYKLSTALIQPMGYTQSMARFIQDAGVTAGLNYSLKGIKDYYRHPIAKAKEIFGKSSFMRQRTVTFDRDVRDATKQLMKGPAAQIENTYFWHIAKMQLAVDLPTWSAAYDWSLDTQPEKGEDAAVAYADSVVRMSQGAGAIKDLAAIQKGGEGVRMFNLFMTYFSAMNNMLIDEARMLKREPTPRQAAQFSTNVFLLTFMPMAMMEALYISAGVAGPDDDENWGEYIAKSWFLQTVGGVPVLRDFISYWVGDFPYALSPVAATIEKAGGLVAQVQQGEVDRAAVNAALAAAGLVSPVAIPTGQIMIMGDYAVDWFAGEKDGFNPIEAFVKRDYRR